MNDERVVVDGYAMVMSGERNGNGSMPAPRSTHPPFSTRPFLLFYATPTKP